VTDSVIATYVGNGVMVLLAKALGTEDQTKIQEPMRSSRPTTATTARTTRGSIRDFRIVGRPEKEENIKMGFVSTSPRNHRRYFRNWDSPLFRGRLWTRQPP